MAESRTDPVLPDTTAPPDVAAEGAAPPVDAVPDLDAAPAQGTTPAQGTAPHRGNRRLTSRPAIAAGVVGLAVLAALAAWRTGTDPGSASPSAGPPAAAPSARSEPRIALIDGKGALATADRAGNTVVLAADPGADYGFPAWSPDGSRVAVVVARAGSSTIEIFDPVATGAAVSPSPAPVVAYRSTASPPFYLYWTPDGQRISFLAGETDGISLRVAPTDGSAPLDSDPAAVLRRGSPLYFEWLADDRLLLHVGTGPDSFAGVVGPDGAALSPHLDGSGLYRPAVADPGGRFIAFVRGQADASRLVVARGDGSAAHELSVLGPAAIAFDPAGTTVAAIAADRADRAALTFPIGPLQLVDAESGAARILLDGDVVGFFWSPDGRTIAALRLQAASGATVAAAGIVPAAAFTGAGTAAGSSPTPGPTPGPELHLLFLGAADGAIRSDRIVSLTSQFVGQLLPYFDQYALSHRLWSPDSASLLLPLLDETGTGHLVILPADGGPTQSLAGSSGFWSP